MDELSGSAEGELVNTSNTVVYSGQGEIADGFGGYDLQTELCGVANGADVDGPYLLWVLTATGATGATITGPWGTATMTQSGGGTYKYISAWYPPASLPGHVSATYSGKVKNAQLVISHGCRPFNPEKPAWCSPGFWGHATDAAWALTGKAKTDLFNASVYSCFYGATLADDPTLWTVLSSSGGTYKGPGVTGTCGFDPALNPFNATGAYLTDNIPGYRFDISFYGQDDSDTCPIDHFGNFKLPQ
jgi:hypothetical protein